GGGAGGGDERRGTETTPRKKKKRTPEQEEEPPPIDQLEAGFKSTAKLRRAQRLVGEAGATTEVAPPQTQKDFASFAASRWKLLLRQARDAGETCRTRSLQRSSAKAPPASAAAATG